MVVRIDGSYGEGGGQILRTSIALSALLGEPVEIVNIRARRPNPGLQPQHLAGVMAAAALADAELEGAARGSTRLLFRPRAIKCGSFDVSIGTAGSISLVIQTLTPIMLFAPCATTVTITGGTDVAWSPPIDYMRYVFARTLSRFGARVEIEVVRRGHYPRGGGKVILRAEPVGRLAAVNSPDFGRLVEVGGVSHAVNLPRHVAERQARSAREVLARAGYDADISVEVRSDGLGPGSGIVLWAASDTGCVVGGDSLGSRGKPAEVVGREAAERLLAVMRAGASLDPHMADMAVVYMALAEGESVLSTSEVTMHLQTNIYVVERFLPVKFELGRADGKYIMRVRGVGHAPSPGLPAAGPVCHHGGCTHAM
ncbi:MAG: RNA 3'-terminal phosphate cyclase [Thermoproteaceae archaeon]|nr:RNA 3'-terminal phosphate cyclase [Thermoproteaceae archaeon]